MMAIQLSAAEVPALGPVGWFALPHRSSLNVENLSAGDFGAALAAESLETPQ
jgi:hypothetical protein